MLPQGEMAIWVTLIVATAVIGLTWWFRRTRDRPPETSEPLADDEGIPEFATPPLPADPGPGDRSGVGQTLQGNMSWLPDAIMVLDSKLQLNWANNTAEEWFGFNLLRHHQLSINSLVDDADLKTYFEERDFRDSHDCQAPGDPDISIRIRVVPYRQGQFLLQARDVTQVRKLEHIRRDFVANASHELRTPVSVLYGYLDMMRQEEGQGISKEWKPAIRQMHEQTARVKQIIDDMMILSRLEDPQTAEEHEFLDVAPLLESAYKNATVLSGERNHVIDCEIEQGYALLGNQQELESLVNNLVSNAVRYTPDGGTIVIRWSADLAGGRMSVIDSGIGIAAEDIPRITERFYRTDPARSRATGGTGLGLAIVNHIVNRHQAGLHIESEPGEGSTFSVEFPRERLKKEPGQVDLLLN